MGAPGALMVTRALVVRLFATLVVWAVAVLTVPSPAAAIKNGQAITKAPAWAAYVTTVSRFLFTQTSETTCTGTIVADGWVMTAAHCVVAEDANGHPTSTPLPISKFEIVLGRSDLGKTWQGGQWTVDQLQIDPKWDPARLTGDVALLHLSGPLPSGAVPLPLAPSSFSVPDGALPLAYGYGCTSTSYGQRALSTGDFANYSCHLSNVLRLTQSRSYRLQRSCTTASDWCLHRAGVSEIQNGDSGGPWVPDDTLRSYVVGITSYNSAPQRTGATTVDWQDHHATRITDPTIHDWIDRTAGIQTGTVGAVYRNAGSGASWLFKRDGFLHSIPDRGTYRCLTAAGAPVVSEGAFQLAELPVSSEPAQCTTPPAYNRSCGTANDGWLVGPTDPNHNNETPYEVHGPWRVYITKAEARRIVRRFPPGEFGTHISLGDTPCIVAQAIALSASNAWDTSWTGDDGSADVIADTYGGQTPIGRFDCTGHPTANAVAAETCTMTYPGGRIVGSFGIFNNPYW